MDCVRIAGMVGFANIENRICKTRQDKTRQNKTRKEKKMKKREFIVPCNITPFKYIVQCEDSKQYELDSLEDGVWTISKSDFFDAFSVITSESFNDLIEALNNKEDARIAQLEAYKEAINNFTETTIYELNVKAVNYGYMECSVTDKRQTIINKVGWCTWVNACRLYETMYRIPREWVG